MADKLDGVMLLLFEYLDRQVSDRTSAHPSAFS